VAGVTMKQLLEAGVHFGHQTRRWNPKMAPYIYGERNGIHIIDLRQTLEQVNKAVDYVRNLTADGGILLFVGTKKQAQMPMAEAAKAGGMHYVNYRWLGGMLTNFTTIQKRVYYMKELERMEATGENQALPKKERLLLSRELLKLRANLGGIADMGRIPDAIFALVDSNCDPDSVDIVIPGNDDAIRSAELIAMALAEACVEGRQLSSKKQPAAQS
jgi:small subunit ribosomal protein S2